MDPKKLVATGLNEQQARAYALLLEKASLTPPVAAKELGLTRSNAYKVLDRLVELRLAKRKDVDKKLAYLPTNPTAFADLSAQQRTQAVAREEAVNTLMQDLLEKYYTHTNQPGVETFSGRSHVAEAYRKQLALREDVYFVRTQADIPAMGFDALHDIRTTPARHGQKRYGILPAPDHGTINYESHRRSNLEITWVSKELYDAPVEWSATASSLLIVSYANEPQAVLIIDPVIASAYLQLWRMMQILLQPTELNQRLHRTT